MDRHTKTIFVAAIALLVIGGGWYAYTISRRPLTQDSRSAIITLERTGCFGACPQYKLTIYDSGLVTYEPTAFPKGVFEAVSRRLRFDAKTATIRADQVNQLILEFTRVNFFALQDAYTEMCVTDHPSVITSITLDGHLKMIEHYQGACNAPVELSTLENTIDAIVKTHEQFQK